VLSGKFIIRKTLKKKARISFRITGYWLYVHTLTVQKLWGFRLLNRLGGTYSIRYKEELIFQTPITFERLKYARSYKYFWTRLGKTNPKMWSKLTGAPVYYIFIFFPCSAYGLKWIVWFYFKISKIWNSINVKNKILNNFQN